MSYCRNRQYTADDEMPDCGHCDHVCDDFDCCKLCGPEHWWAGYIRTELEDADEDLIRVIKIAKVGTS